jgi:hypothetical protein
MNGKLNAFYPATTKAADIDAFMKEAVEAGYSADELNAAREWMAKQEIFLNDEYQVNIDKNPAHGFTQFDIWHLSIKRIDRDIIHDWRDLQQIKNLLVGPEYEAIEVYPAESRLMDSANQYHLWVFVACKNVEGPPTIPIGWTTRLVTDKSIGDSINRPFDK